MLNIIFSCCHFLQLTFQASHLEEAVSLYDQLAPLCPIMLAITASNPISKGKVPYLKVGVL